MPTAVIALKLTDAVPQIEGDYIGVDKGTVALLAHGIKAKLAIGDFDSVDEREMQQIRENIPEVISLNPIKDDTDSEAAFNEAVRRGYDRIIFLGALGGRADHTLINLRLAYQHPGLVTLIDEQNTAEAFIPGTYEIKKEDHAYISFFTEDDAEISLEGFKYPLSHCHLTEKDLFTVSNELNQAVGHFTIHHGTVLMIQSKDKEQ
ncbi:MAG: thiamine diphosphokinase [Erysipelotrichaceae bacterium]|jgi:thiamine pyrophosphokinase|nr:thiamine diphosphokinase [Erysipelotrichaceae bacterium]